jgi:hypothetical protein
VVYVSGLFSKGEPLIELAWQARRYRDVDLVVVDPTAGMETEEDAMATEVRRRKLTNALGRGGIPCYTGEPLDLVQRIFAP